MNATVKTGILLGLLCSFWTYVMGLTGWYKDITMMNIFYVVILIEVGTLAFALSQTRYERGYAGQVATGILISLIGALIIMVNSVIFTMVIFPDYFDEIRTAYTELLRTEGKTEEEIARMIRAMSGSYTPAMQAISGFLGTIFTGLVASLIIAIFYRRKEQDEHSEKLNVDVQL